LRSAVGLALVGVALAACGADDEERDYPDEAVASFVSECRKQPNATEAACRCVIERLQVSMPYAEFERADAALRASRTPEEGSLRKLRTAAEGCLAG
jgi:hypothetical protein